MAEPSLPLNSELAKSESRLDSILAQLDTLGSSAAEIRGEETPKLYSVPALTEDVASSAVVADASAVAAAMADHPRASLHLVTDEPLAPAAPAPPTPEPAAPVPQPQAATPQPQAAIEQPPAPQPSAPEVENDREPEVAQQGFLADYRPGGTSGDHESETMPERRPTARSIFGSKDLPPAAVNSSSATNDTPAAATQSSGSVFDDLPPAAQPPARRQPEAPLPESKVQEPAMVSPFDAQPSIQPSNRFTPPDTIISQPDAVVSQPDAVVSQPEAVVSQPDAVEPVSEAASSEPVKIDYFADLDSAEPVAIAGVDPKHMVGYQNEEDGNESPPSQPVETAPEALDVFPFNLDQQALTDPSGLLQDPLDIKNATPEKLDAEYFDEAHGHGVAFPAAIAGAPTPEPAVATASPAQVQTIADQARDFDNELDEGPLSARLLIISTILLAIIALAVIQLDDPDTVETIRQSFRSLFG